MSSYLTSSAEVDPFDSHPAAAAFMGAAKFALEHYGDERISRDTLLDLQYTFALPTREVPALAYLAQKRVIAREEVTL